MYIFISLLVILLGGIVGAALGDGAGGATVAALIMILGALRDLQDALRGPDLRHWEKDEERGGYKRKAGLAVWKRKPQS